MQNIIPTPLRIILTLAATALAVLNQTTIAGSGEVHAALLFVALFIGSLGIPALTGQAFQDWLATTFPGEWLRLARTIITAILGFLTLVLTNTSWAPGIHALIAGAIALLVSLGFGPIAGLPAGAKVVPPIAPAPPAPPAP